MHKLEFSSAVLADNLKSKAIEDIFSNQLLMDLDPSEDHRQFFELKALSTPALTLAYLSGSPAQATRSHDQAANSTEDLVLCVTHNADVRIETHRGQEQIFNSGEAHIWKADKKFACEVNKNYSTFMLHIPAISIQTANIDPEQAMDRGRLEGTADFRILTGYIKLVMEEFAKLTPQTIEKSLQHIQDLALYSIGTLKERTYLDMENSVQAVRLASLKKDIENNISHPELSAEWIANREGISTRYLRSLFLQESTNFTRYVLERRLIKAYQKLTVISLQHRTISDIAYSVGFGDLSYFIRCFKKRFEATPSDVRRHHFSK